jgi:hypothetical protein
MACSCLFQLSGDLVVPGAVAGSVEEEDGCAADSAGGAVAAADELGFGHEASPKNGTSSVMPAAARSALNTA